MWSHSYYSSFLDSWHRCRLVLSPLEYKTSYSDFFKAIEYAVDICYPSEAIPVLGMGSGTDSGTIATALHASNKKFTLCCVEGNENLDVLHDRIKYLDVPTKIIPDQTDAEVNEAWDDMEKAGFTDAEFGKYRPQSHFILSKHIPNSYLYSGLGTDEFYTNNFIKLCEFMHYSHRAYNHFNIQTIFPLLRNEVFLEFYLLHPDMRANYKQPFEEYMRSKNFAVDETKKNFSIQKGRYPNSMNVRG